MRCSFCGEIREDAECKEGLPLPDLLDAGPNLLSQNLKKTNKSYRPEPTTVVKVQICIYCIDGFATALREADERMVTSVVDSIPSPVAIKGYLDRYIIGQSEAKKVLANEAWTHLHRLRKADQGFTIDKSNVLLIGPTGCGKTLLARQLATAIDVPFVEVDATSFTEAGYVGDGVEICLHKLLTEADGDVDKAERGIVFIDEIDKKKAVSRSNGRDVSGEGVQQALLKMIEGAEVSVEYKKGERLTISTQHILFIMSGAFPGLEKDVTKRFNAGAGVGFHQQLKQDLSVSECLENLETGDLEAYGLLPELLGRLPVVIGLHELTREDIRRILTEPENAIIRQYEELYAGQDIEILFDDSALDLITDQAMKSKTGARGLRSILEKAVRDVCHYLPSWKEAEPELQGIIIDADYLLRNKQVSRIYKEDPSELLSAEQS